MWFILINLQNIRLFFYRIDTIDFSFIVDECPLGISVGSDRLTAADHIHG